MAGSQSPSPQRERPKTRSPSQRGITEGCCSWPEPMKYPGTGVHGGRRPEDRKRCHKLSWQPQLRWHAARSLHEDPTPLSGSRQRHTVGPTQGLKADVVLEGCGVGGIGPVGVLATQDDSGCQIHRDCRTSRDQRRPAASSLPDGNPPRAAEPLGSSQTPRSPRFGPRRSSRFTEVCAWKPGPSPNTHNLEPHLCYSRLHATSGAGTG